MNQYHARIKVTLFSHTLMLLNTRLCVWPPLGPKLQHFPQDLQPAESVHAHSEKMFDNSARQTRDLF